MEPQTFSELAREPVLTLRRGTQKNLVDFRFSFACLWAMWADPNEGLALKYVTFET
jgi:hypothetical protein